MYATDFSVSSRLAGTYAMYLAAWFSARLLAAHAFTLSEPAMEAEAEGASASRQRKDLQTLLSEQAAVLTSTSVKPVPVLVEGDPKEEIPRLAEENAPSLIVLGTHGGGRVERKIIGSVAEAILRATRRPALIVGPKVQTAVFPFRRVLYAAEVTPASIHAAAFAAVFAEEFGAEINVLHVLRPEDVRHPEHLSELIQRCYGPLRDLEPQRAQEFCDARAFVETGSAQQQIMKHIRERSIDLLVLGAATSAHFSLGMHTSAVFQMIVDAPCPVLTVTLRT
ncbi:universal stress protein [Paracidobacterium acidisoli]|uniref:universal stress protein n=1 Tax=Paracidobacterium acidisoli TaxID=2303751 RepID=UPI0011C16634|nr:universal stress protein [Paracidobacterium acidisoli]